MAPIEKSAVRVDNWAHADSLSCLYARILDEDPKAVLPQLKKWNVSKNPWLRRLSIVSLIYYNSQRQMVLPFEEIISLVKPQLEFEHYYVQKGVGWTLRECHNVYPEETFAFVLEHIRILSSYGFSTAMEKMSPRKREILKRATLKSRLA